MKAKIKTFMSIAIENIKIGECLLTFEGTLADKKAKYIDKAIVVHSHRSAATREFLIKLIENVKTKNFTSHV